MNACLLCEAPETRVIVATLPHGSRGRSPSKRRLLVATLSHGAFGGGWSAVRRACVSRSSANAKQYSLYGSLRAAAAAAFRCVDGRRAFRGGVGTLPQVGWDEMFSVWRGERGAAAAFRCAHCFRSGSGSGSSSGSGSVSRSGKKRVERLHAGFVRFQNVGGELRGGRACRQRFR